MVFFKKKKKILIHQFTSSVENNFKCKILYVKQIFNESSFSMQVIFQCEFFFEMMQVVFSMKAKFQCK
jgi:hypothetical protein